MRTILPDNMGETMKRWGVILVLLMPLLLVACGGGGSSGDTEPSSNWDEMKWDQGEWA